MGTECSARIASPAVSFGVGENEETDTVVKGRERFFSGVASSGWKRPSEVAFGAASGAEMEDHDADDTVADPQDSELEGGGELELEAHHGSDMGESVDSDEPAMGYPPPSPMHSQQHSCSMTHWNYKPHALATPMLHDQTEMLGLDTSRQLHEAIGRGYFTLAEHLIDTGVPLHVRDATGRQPLHIACEANCKWLVQKLVLAGANTLEKDKLHRTALECTSSPHVAMALSEPLRWRRSMNRVYPWDFRRRVVALAMSMEAVYEEGSSSGVVPRHYDLLDQLVAGLAVAVSEAQAVSSVVGSVAISSNNEKVQDEEREEDREEQSEEQSEEVGVEENVEEVEVEQLCGICDAHDVPVQEDVLRVDSASRRRHSMSHFRDFPSVARSVASGSDFEDGDEFDV